MVTDPVEKVLLIRADAGPRIGMGHVMRCLALAQAWQETGGKAIFVMSQCSPGLEHRLKTEDMIWDGFFDEVEIGSLEDGRETVTIARNAGADWVVVDGYAFHEEYHQTIRQAGQRLLVIDDCGPLEAYHTDMLLNQNIYAALELYPRRNSKTTFLLGPRYVLLRKEFRQWQGWRREVAREVKKILVTLGGADPDNVTQRVLRSLQRLHDRSFEVAVVVGDCNPYQDQLQTMLQHSCHHIRIEKNAADMPDLMRWADIAIANGGTTIWELACMGLPAIIFIVADNQQANVEGLEKQDVLVNLGWHASISEQQIAWHIAQLCDDYDKRRELSEQMTTVVDGNGARRVIAAMQK